MRHRSAAVLAFTLGALLAVPGVVYADCQPVESVEAALREAEVAFVGTAVASARGVGTVTFRVEEAWVGTLGETVEVRGLNANQPAEDDRTWERGGRYLVIPYVVQGRLVDHICSGTTPWNEDLAALRPTGAPSAPEPSDEPAPALPVPHLILAISGLLLGSAGWLAFQRRERSAQAPPA